MAIEMASDSAEVASTSAARHRLRIWDAPTRIAHWTLVALFALSWWTAENNVLDIHRISGYGILGIVLFRILWGFFGSASARFGSFMRNPREVFSYATQRMFNRAHTTAGHNPLGGWSILLMLVLLSLQTGTGLFAVDVDGIESGPLSYLISFDAGRSLAHFHKWTFNALLWLIALHLVAVAFYCIYKREALISAMLTGYKSLASPAGAGIWFASWWRFLATVVAVVIVVCGIASGLRI